MYIEVFQNYRGRSQLAGSASGIIISSDGYIVTNNHVVEGADSYTAKVKCTDESCNVTSQVYDAELIGTDSDTDLAVIKIDAEDLPVAVLDDSDKLCLGDDVVAIGNPLGLENSVSKGIVSGRAVIGIMYLEVTDSIAAYNGITAGWQVTDINSDMPVAESGLLVGDTIVKIDGLDVFKDDVSEIFTTKKPGETVTVTVVRSDSLGRKCNVNIDIVLSESKG